VDVSSQSGMGVGRARVIFISYFFLVTEVAGSDATSGRQLCLATFRGRSSRRRDRVGGGSLRWSLVVSLPYLAGLVRQFK
jgi:hypothetical protein